MVLQVMTFSKTFGLSMTSIVEGHLQVLKINKNENNFYLLFLVSLFCSRTYLANKSKYNKSHFISLILKFAMNKSLRRYHSEQKFFIPLGVNIGRSAASRYATLMPTTFERL